MSPANDALVPSPFAIQAKFLCLKWISALSFIGLSFELEIMPLDLALMELRGMLRAATSRLATQLTLSTTLTHSLARHSCARSSKSPRNGTNGASRSAPYTDVSSKLRSHNDVTANRLLPVFSASVCCACR